MLFPHSHSVFGVSGTGGDQNTGKGSLSSSQSLLLCLSASPAFGISLILVPFPVFDPCPFSQCLIPVPFPVSDPCPFSCV